MDISSIFIAIGVAIATSMLGEVLVWYMVYRHDDYKLIVEKVLSDTKTLDNMKAKQMMSSATQTPAQQK